MVALSHSALNVVVGSKNSVKVHAVQRALTKCLPSLKFHIAGANADSLVAAQPIGCDETQLGAVNRIQSLKATGHSGLLVAVEGGVARVSNGGYECFAWVAAEHTPTGATSNAKSGSFLLPASLCKLLDEGLELGEADDKVFGRVKSGQGTGTIGYLSNNLITRTDYYEHTAMLCLLPWMKPEVYGSQYRLVQ